MLQAVALACLVSLLSNWTCISGDGTWGVQMPDGEKWKQMTEGGEAKISICILPYESTK